MNTLTQEEIEELKKRKATLRAKTEQIDIEVRIIEIRNPHNSFGRVDCLVTPVSGSGQTWVSLVRLKLL